MIENIRKYTGLMIVVLVLLFLGLIFLESSASNLTSGAPAMEVAGRNISQKEFARMSTNTLKIPSRLPFSAIPTDSQKNPLTNLLGGRPAFSSDQLLRGASIALEADRPERFLANRFAIQKAGLEYGATPGQEEVEAFIENVLFADADGKFDQESYADFIEKKIGSLGIGIRGFNEYVRDLLTAGNLAELISGDIESDPTLIESLYRNGSQKITAQQVSLEFSTYQNEQTPTEEEIEAYWEENQEKYNTDERRKISYVFFEPDWDAALVAAEEEKKKAEDAKKAQEEAAAKLKEEARKAEEAAKKANEANSTPAPTETPEGDQGNIGAQGDPAPVTPVTPAVEVPVAPTVTPPAVIPTKKPELPEPSAKDKLTPAQRQKAVKDLSNKANKFYIPLVNASGNTFEVIAQKQGLKIITTEFFTRLDAPDRLKQRATNSRLGTLADIAFAISAEAQNDQRITEPYTTSEGWFVGKIEEVVASRQESYEEAKVKATVDLKKEMARKKLATEAVSIREKIEALVAAGKSFEEAAKELKLTFQKLPNLSVPQRAQFIPPAFDAARYTTPGTIAKTKFTPNEESPERALIVFVEKREVTTDEAYKNGLKSMTDNQNLAIRLATFQNWLRDRYDENEVQYFNKDQER